MIERVRLLALQSKIRSRNNLFNVPRLVRIRHQEYLHLPILERRIPEANGKPKNFLNSSVNLAWLTKKKTEFRPRYHYQVMLLFLVYRLHNYIYSIYLYLPNGSPSKAAITVRDTKYFAVIISTWGHSQQWVSSEYFQQNNPSDQWVRYV